MTIRFGNFDVTSDLDKRGFSGIIETKKIPIGPGSREIENVLFFYFYFFSLNKLIYF